MDPINVSPQRTEWRAISIRNLTNFGDVFSYKKPDFDTSKFWCGHHFNGWSSRSATSMLELTINGSTVFKGGLFLILTSKGQDHEGRKKIKTCLQNVLSQNG